MHYFHMQYYLKSILYDIWIQSYGGKFGVSSIFRYISPVVRKTDMYERGKKKRLAIVLAFSIFKLHTCN